METLTQRRDRLNAESIRLAEEIKKRRLRLGKVKAALRRTLAAIAGRVAGPGIDVSAHQGRVDWAKVAATGVRWAGVKATEGRGFVDERWRDNVKGATAAGLAVLAYAFGRPDTGGATVADARAECDDFVETVRATGAKLISFRDWKAGKPGVHGVLDFEVRPFSPGWAEAWARRYIEHTGHKPSAYGFGASLNPIAAVLEKHFAGVWFAAFVGPDDDWRKFCVDSLEDNVFAHQWTSTGAVPGVTGNVDRNRWIG